MGVRRPSCSPRRSTCTIFAFSGKNCRYGKSVPSISSASHFSIARYPDAKPSSPVIPTSYGFCHSMCSLPRSACTIGACSFAASAITSSCAPATPAPARIVTFFAPFRMDAAASSPEASGVTVDRVGRIGAVARRSGASAKNTSPGTTTTATPRFSTAVRMAISSTHGSCAGSPTSSE